MYEFTEIRSIPDRMPSAMTCRMQYSEIADIILIILWNFPFRISTSYRNLGHLHGLRPKEIHIKSYRSIARNCLRVCIIKIIPHHICKRWASARWAWRCQFAHSKPIRILDPYLNPFFEWPINCECVCDDSSLFSRSENENTWTKNAIKMSAPIIVGRVRALKILVRSHRDAFSSSPSTSATTTSFSTHCVKPTSTYQPTHLAFFSFRLRRFFFRFPFAKTVDFYEQSSWKQKKNRWSFACGMNNAAYACCLVDANKCVERENMLRNFRLRSFIHYY